MSDTRHNRFEIDLEEIERQLRRSAEMAPVASAASPRGVTLPAASLAGTTPTGIAAPTVGASYGSDPLADLARIVGQDDPFFDILGDGKKAAAEPPRPAARAPAPLELNAEERDVLGSEPDIVPAVATGVPSRRDPRFDPVSQAYGEAVSSVDDDEFQPLPPRGGRGRLFAVVAVVVLAVGGIAGVLLWRSGGRGLIASGPPPLVRADNAPVKVAPQNPGGMEIPDQSRQIYERKPETARSQVLDRQEQPLDVREAARTLPPAPTRTAPAEVATTVPAARIPALPEASAPAGGAAPAAPGAAPAPPNAVISALGEPRRVRTVAVRPDGSAYAPDSSRVPSEAAPPSIPTSLPPPVSVATVAVPANPLPVTPPSAAAGASVGPAVQILPPARPGSVGAAAAIVPPPAVPAGPTIASLSATDSAPPPVTPDPPPAGRVDSSAPAVAVQPPKRPAGIGRQTAEAAPDPAAATPGTFAVQIATRSSEAEARTASAALSERFAADLGGQPTAVTRAEVGGRPVYRVRVTPLSRGDADGLCGRLKANGGACFVVAN